MLFISDTYRHPHFWQKAMVRPIIATLFLIAFLGQTFNRAFIMLDYYTNTAAFAKNCENKARPMMHCNGKCQMMKKIKQEEKKDQENPERKAENKNEIVLSSKSFAPLLPKLSYLEITTKLQYPQAENGYSFNPSNSIFHPPKA
jgi:hypothetical protein